MCLGKDLTARQDALVQAHGGMVKGIAHHLVSRLPPSVQVDDMLQAGMLGLLEAARHYDQDQGTSFEAYAGSRIRGAMLDELRRYDWTPRSVHRKARAIAEAIQAIEMQTGRDARDSEVANQLGLALAEYYRVLQDIMGCRVLSIEELLEAGDTGFGQSSQTSLEPMEGLTRARFASSLADAIASLPERERLIISLYYNDERNLREIAQVLSISESRVCQIQGQALLRLRARLGEWLDEPSATASAGRSAGSRSTRRRKTPPSPDA